MMGPCWPMMLVTFSLIIGIAGGVLMWASKDAYSWVVWAGALLLTFNISALCLTACNNPGICKRRQQLPPCMGPRGWRYNSKAQAFQPPGSRYCEECQVFVRDYDHFCPWTGTAIGG